MKKLGVVCFLFLLTITGCSKNRNKELLNYLNSRYGNNISFEQTDTVYGGGIGVSHHYRGYKVKNDEREFIVGYQIEDDEIVSICDQYMEIRFSNDVKKLYSCILDSSKVTDYFISVEPGTSCSYDLMPRPTNNFEEYIKDENSDLSAFIWIKKSSFNMTKEQISNTIINHLDSIGIKSKLENLRLGHIRILVVNDSCNFNDNPYICDKYEEFEITKLGYKEIGV